jgi:gliding motility associated protien GldN
MFEVRILGICVEAPYQQKGVAMGNKRYFWVYFPECRNLFAQNEVFNLKNGAAGRLTYDDVFMKRMFSSYITKEENVYDRRVAEYAKGIDALLESERIKNTLQEFESNLWEY